MGVSVFPPVAGDSGSGFSNFAIDLGDYTDNTTTLSQPYPAGGYSIGSDPSDTTLDFYLLDADGALVGYSGTAAITATGAFTTVVVLGGQADLKLSFTFSGEAGVPDTAGTSLNAGAYITSTTPTDLPDINDTTTVTGGNFATDVEMNFVSGEVTLAAKSITRASSVELVVGRPDALDAALDPWSMRVNNPGVPVPSGSNVNKIEVTAGATPVWVTTSPLTAGQVNQAYTVTFEATDSDPDSSITYTVIAGSFAGLTLDSATGVLSGTPTENSTATVRATDAGGNSNDREFSTAFALAAGGIVTENGGYRYHTFNSSGTLNAYGSITCDYLVVAGGGAGGDERAGGGGAGGYKSFENAAFNAGNYSVVVGTGGQSVRQNGTNSSFNSQTSTGGGHGQGVTGVVGSGGSGGGGFNGAGGGSGIAGQGFRGGNGSSSFSAGGGGAGRTGVDVNNTNSGGGFGLQWLNGSTYAGGGGAGGYTQTSGGSGGGGFGGGNQQNAGNATANTGGGGGGAGNNRSTAGIGASGVVIIRYAI